MQMLTWSFSIQQNLTTQSIPEESHWHYPTSLSPFCLTGVKVIIINFGGGGNPVSQATPSFISERILRRETALVTRSLCN